MSTWSSLTTLPSSLTTWSPVVLLGDVDDVLGGLSSSDFLVLISRKNWFLFFMNLSTTWSVLGFEFGDTVRVRVGVRIRDRVKIRG